MHPWQRKFFFIIVTDCVHHEVWAEAEERVQHQAYDRALGWCKNKETSDERVHRIE
jgi:hypothetical protein